MAGLTAVKPYRFGVIDKDIKVGEIGCLVLAHGVEARPETWYIFRRTQGYARLREVRLRDGMIFRHEGKPDQIASFGGDVGGVVG